MLRLARQKKTKGNNVLRDTVWESSPVKRTGRPPVLASMLRGPISGFLSSAIRCSRRAEIAWSRNRFATLLLRTAARERLWNPNARWQRLLTPLVGQVLPARARRICIYLFCGWFFSRLLFVFRVVLVVSLRDHS